MIILKGNQIMSLNPFEVREVLQDQYRDRRHLYHVSIPLKSGRCCKRLPQKLLPNPYVSIPLKSGRCCKFLVVDGDDLAKSQSL